MQSQASITACPVACWNETLKRVCAIAGIDRRVPRGLHPLGGSPAAAGAGVCDAEAHGPHQRRRHDGRPGGVHRRRLRAHTPLPQGTRGQVGLLFSLEQGLSVVHYVVCLHTGRMLQVVQTNKGCALATASALSRLLLQAVLAIAYSSGLRESAVLAVKSPYCNAWQDALSSVVLLPAVQAEGACGVAQVHAGAGGGTLARGRLDPHTALRLVGRPRQRHERRLGRSRRRRRRHRQPRQRLWRRRRGVTLNPQKLPSKFIWSFWLVQHV